MMAIIFLAGKLSERKTDFYNTLALSAIIILLIDSKQLLQPGFQLSYAAVFSLVYLYPKVYAMRRFLPFALGRKRWISACAAAVSVSLSAGIGTLPFTSVYFGKISLVSFAANIIVVPLSNLILAAGMLTIGVSYFSSWLASVYAAATSFLTSCLLTTVSFFGDLPFAYLNSHFTVWSSLAFYGAIGFLVKSSRRETRTRSIIALLVAVDLWLYVELLEKPRPLRVTFIDVGQGDGALVELPDGRSILIDAGPESSSGNAGVRFIEPYLRRQGIRRLDDIVLSHPHSDHLGGIPYLLRHFAVGRVDDAGSWAHSVLFRDYLHCIDSIGVPRKVLGGGSRMEGFDGIRLYVMHPSSGFIPQDTTIRSNLNNQSLVLKLVYGRSSLLFAGDAEKEAEDRMIDIYGSFLKSGVLKTAHHGSLTSSSDRFLDLVKPAVAVVSVGARNKFHLPSATVLKRLSDHGARYYRTDESGAVVIESDGEGWTVVDWR
jgi:competence protein ComEC